MFQFLYLQSYNPTIIPSSLLLVLRENLIDAIKWSFIPMAARKQMWCMVSTNSITMGIPCHGQVAKTVNQSAPSPSLLGTWLIINWIIDMIATTIHFSIYGTNNWSSAYLESRLFFIFTHLRHHYKKYQRLATLLTIANCITLPPPKSKYYTRCWNSLDGVLSQIPSGFQKKESKPSLSGTWLIISWRSYFVWCHHPFFP